MSGVWTIEVEQSTGDTSTSRLTMLPLRWSACEVTLRRRGPAVIDITIPRFGHHTLSDFVSGREMRISRDGVYWLAGFQNAATLSGGTSAGIRDAGSILLPCQGNEAALIRFVRNTPRTGTLGVEYGAGSDSDSVINAQLDNSEQGSTDWFGSADRTIGSATYSAVGYTPRGGTSWEAILAMADQEAWEVRAGVASDGDFTFKAGGAGTGYTDLTATVHLIDGANCVITGLARDDSQLTTVVHVASRAQAARTYLNGAHTAPDSTITVDSTDGFFAGQSAIIGSGTAEETVLITTIDSATQFSIFSATSINHSDNDPVRVRHEDYVHSDAQSAASSVEQAHHKHFVVHWDDQLADNEVLRDRLGVAIITAYDHVLNTATVTVTDAPTLALLLDQGCRPGDRIKLTAIDTDLATLWSNTTVTVQEMTLSLEAGACTGIVLALGDPALDDLATVEKAVRSAAKAATMTSGL